MLRGNEGQSNLWLYPTQFTGWFTNWFIPKESEWVKYTSQGPQLPSNSPDITSLPQISWWDRFKNKLVYGGIYEESEIPRSVPPASPGTVEQMTGEQPWTPEMALEDTWAIQRTQITNYFQNMGERVDERANPVSNLTKMITVVLVGVAGIFVVKEISKR